MSGTVIVASRLPMTLQIQSNEQAPGNVDAAHTFDIVGPSDPGAVGSWGLTYDVDEATFTDFIAVNPWYAADMMVVTQEQIDYHSDPSNTHGFELWLNPPTNIDAPYVSQTGMMLNCTMGNWGGEPTTYRYSWFQDGSTGVGTDANTLAVVPEYAGSTMTCVVAAGNATGFTEGPPSNGVVVAILPTVIDIPSVSQAGMVLSCTLGNWNGEPSNYAYQWKLNNVNVGTNAPNYTAQSADGGKTATCVVTATNAAGSTAAPPSVGVVVVIIRPITIDPVPDHFITDPCALTGTVDPPGTPLEASLVNPAGVEGTYYACGVTSSTWLCNLGSGAVPGSGFKARVRQTGNHAVFTDSNTFALNVLAQLYIVTNPLSPQVAGPVTLGGNILPGTLPDKRVEAAPLISGVAGTYVPMVTTGTTWTGSVTMVAGTGVQIRARVVTQPTVFKDSTAFDVT